MTTALVHDAMDAWWARFAKDVFDDLDDYSAGSRAILPGLSASGFF